MKGWMKWMANNHVAANLLMLVFIVGGLIRSKNIKEEIFPEIQLDMIRVQVPYPGAGPEEVEEGIILKIEDNLTSVDGIEELNSVAAEGMGTVTAELRSGEDPDVVLQEIKNEVDRIVTFPEEAEKPVITKLLNRVETISIVVYGDLNAHALKEMAEDIREELLVNPEITQVDLSGVRPYEISIEVPEDNLRRYGLTLDQVAQAVRQASLDLPGGTIRTEEGHILLRTKEKRYTAREYENITVIGGPDGSRVKLRDIANVRDTFAETDQFAYFDGQPAVQIKVFRVGDQRPTEIAEIVKNYVKDKRISLPGSVNIRYIYDTSVYFKSRLDLLKKNAFFGLTLVMIILGLFLEIRLALWVMLGVPVSVLGAMLFLPALGVSINMMSLFAFILALGILVDDAIVVGENIYEHRQKGKPFKIAAIDGAIEVGIPVVFSVLTTIAAFAPLLMIPGSMGKFIWMVPAVVITLLAVSLIESLFVLPSHLSKGKKRESSSGILGVIDSVRLKASSRLENFSAGSFRRILDRCVRYRYLTVAVAVALLMITFGIYKGGIIKFTFMPKVDGDRVRVSLVMPPGTPAEETDRIVNHIVDRGLELVPGYDSLYVKGDTTILDGFYSMVGGSLMEGGPLAGSGEAQASNIGNIDMLIVESDYRTITAAKIEEDWRRAVGEIPGVESLTFSSNLVRMGANIDVQLAHRDFEVLDIAAERLKDALDQYPGVSDIEDTYLQGKRELKFTLKPEARTLGVSEMALARQVRAAYYGSEARRLQIGRNEVKVMVRYPEKDRKSLWQLGEMRIRTPNGGEIPLERAAFIEEGTGFSTINRTDRKRVIDVQASVDADIANSQEIMDDLDATVLAQLKRDYPSLTYKFVGEEKERSRSMGGMIEGFLMALIAIYFLLAIPFRSYSQPLLIMMAIPFGIVGAVLGHLIMGYNLSMLSMFGIVALSGVVVNDSLLLIDRINHNRGHGMGVHEALLDAGQRRLRPILLTSFTTFFGLMPMILETSVQARFLIPMAISLGFGIIFSTGILLLLVPALYHILEDVHGLFGFTDKESAVEYGSMGDIGQ